jgi:hypothetical protein
VSFEKEGFIDCLVVALGNVSAKLQAVISTLSVHGLLNDRQTDRQVGRSVGKWIDGWTDRWINE